MSSKSILMSNDSRLGKRWWADEDPTSELWALMERLSSKQLWRRESDDLALRLYADCRYVGYRPRWDDDVTDVMDARMADNQIRSITRTLMSKVIKHRPRATVVPVGSSWKQKKRCENLQKWIDGKFISMFAYEEIFTQAVLHALILGTGAIRSYSTPDEGAMLEVVPSYEIIVDDAEAVHGKPRSIYILRRIDRAVLIANYPEHAEVILQAGEKSHNLFGLTLSAWDYGRDVDLVTVAEGWHLASGPDSGDGRHVISVDTGTILDEEWTRKTFPLAFLRGERRPFGMWGIGVPEDLAGAQLELNRTNLVRQDIIHMLGNPYWLIEAGSKVVPGHVISGIIGRILKWTGVKPELVSPNAVPGELWKHGDDLKRSMFEARGVSQLAAQMLKPSGLNSGKALRTYAEFEAELLVDLIRGLENMVLKGSHLLIEEQRDLGEQDRSQAVTAVGRGKADAIRWADVQMDRDKYVIQVVPTSSLSNTVSGKLEDIRELNSLGAISDPEEIRDLLDLPDLNRQKRRSMSHRELAEMVIEELTLEKGKAVQPEPSWDLQLHIDYGLETYNACLAYDDVPEDRLRLLLEYIANCRLVLEQGKMPPPAEAGAGAGAGESMEGAPPEAGMSQELLPGPVPPGAGGPPGPVPPVA